MEQSVLLDSSKSESINECLTTPSRVQKRLFISSTSSKRSLFREQNNKKCDEENISDTESDLGHMSPLALTDHSSSGSSPGRSFVSPFTTPEKFPINLDSDYNCLRSKSIKNNCDELLSPYSLKRIIKSAKFSQKSIFEFLPQSKLCQLNKNSKFDNTRNSYFTDQSIVNKIFLNECKFNDQQLYVAETPQKENNLKSKLITPLGSTCIGIPIPRIHRRKSSDSFKNNESVSPEIKKCVVKRYFHDSLSVFYSQNQKFDKPSFVPKARAALFQENKNIEKEIGFTLNPKSFYGVNDNSLKSIESEWREPQIDVKKKRILPLYSSIHKRSIKKHKKGEINCGVGHGIKKPKSKRQSLINVIKCEKYNYTKKICDKSKENLNPQTQIINNYHNEKIISKEIDLSKKFFKNKFSQKAIVTVNDKIKLKVVFNQTDIKHINKKPRLDEHFFDPTDLTVDKTSIEEQNKVINILKILENDWKENDYEAKSIETIKKNAISPKKSNILKDMSMSPASELSTMASTMNIEDISIYTQDHSITKNKNMEIPLKKLYPLFSKNYSSNIIDNENNSKKRKRITSWQLSKKYNNINNQYQIDAGQVIFGATQCKECGIIYHIGDPNDEIAHLNYHSSFKSLKFQGWKNERIIYEDYSSSSRIILIEPKDSNLYWNKVNEVLKIVDQELGLCDTKLSFYRDKRIYMYIRNKTILGILVAEYLKTAFQMIPDLIELNCCTSETTSVKCGINVVWIVMSHRRQGIATKMVDVLRANYFYGYIMSTEDIAFSTPTSSGKRFAEKYTKTRNFKVY